MSRLCGAEIQDRPPIPEAERTKRSLLAALLGMSLLAGSGCARFEVGIDEQLQATVSDRLSRKEHLPLAEFSATPPKSLEQELSEFRFPPSLRKPDFSRADSAAASPESPPAAQTRPLTLDKVREIALRNNLNIQTVRIDPAIAATRVSEEWAKFDQLIFGGAKFNRIEAPQKSGALTRFKTLDPQSPLADQIVRLEAAPETAEFLDFNAGVSIPLRSGARITLEAPLTSKDAPTLIRSQEAQTALRFSISQPLLRNAGTAANVASIRIADYDQRAASVRTRLEAIRILAAIDRAYWNVYGAWEELEVRQQQYELAYENLRMVRRQVEEGIQPAVEINRAEVGVAERMEALIVAETALKLRQRQLQVLMNDPQWGVDTTIPLVPETAPTLVEFELDRHRLVEKALADRLELLELELRLAADTTRIDFLRNQRLPLFLLDYHYAGLGEDPAFGGVFNAYDEALRRRFSDWSVGLRFEVPLHNTLRKAQLERAVSERLQRLTTKQLRELTVRREIHDALDLLQQNWQRIITSRQNVIVAGINYDVELKQFREGLRTMLEVLIALTRLGEAQIREVRAIVDYQVALVDLAFATGTLLGHSRVDIGF